MEKPDSSPFKFLMVCRIATMVFVLEQTVIAVIAGVMPGPVLIAKYLLALTCHSAVELVSHNPARLRTAFAELYWFATSGKGIAAGVFVLFFAVSIADGRSMREERANLPPAERTAIEAREAKEADREHFFGVLMRSRH